MNINPICANFNFGKTYIDKIDVKTCDGNKETVDLVEYNPFDKKDKLQIHSFKNDWGKDAKLIDQFIKSFEFAGESSHVNLSSGNFIKKDNSPVNYRYFGLENNIGDTLAIAETSDIENDEELEIGLIQVNPKEIYGSNKRCYKGLGAALVGKIVEFARQIGKTSVVTLSDNDDFWYDSTFFKKEEDSENTMFLSCKDYNNYIKYAKGKVNS